MKQKIKATQVKGNFNTTFTFCGGSNCCPSVVFDSKHPNRIIVGGEAEGYTEFDKKQFAEFVNTAKQGSFDKYIK